MAAKCGKCGKKIDDSLSDLGVCDDCSSCKKCGKLIGPDIAKASGICRKCEAKERDQSNQQSIPEEEPETTSDTKTCPYCAEKIKAAAIKCKHCQADLSVSNTPVKVCPSCGSTDVAKRSAVAAQEQRAGTSTGSGTTIGAGVSSGGMAVGAARNKISLENQSQSALGAKAGGPEPMGKAYKDNPHLLEKDNLQGFSVMSFMCALVSYWFDAYFMLGVFAIAGIVLMILSYSIDQTPYEEEKKKKREKRQNAKNNWYRQWMCRSCTHIWIPD